MTRVHYVTVKPQHQTQGPEEMCLSLEHQNPSKTSEKMGYFDRVTAQAAQAHYVWVRFPISLKLPPARPKSVYLPVRRAPGSKFGCMSSRSAAFRIDSGQLRFAMMRNLTVILRDSNLGA